MEEQDKSAVKENNAVSALAEDKTSSIPTGAATSSIFSKDYCDYLFQLYNCENDSYLKKLNFYIVIEIALFTLVAASRGYALSNNALFLISLIGLTFTFFIFIAAYYDSKYILTLIEKLASVEPQIIGPNKIFQDISQGKGKISKDIHLSMLFLALLAWIAVFIVTII